MRVICDVGVIHKEDLAHAKESDLQSGLGISFIQARRLLEKLAAICLDSVPDIAQDVQDSLPTAPPMNQVVPHMPDIQPLSGQAAPDDVIATPHVAPQDAPRAAPQVAPQTATRVTPQVSPLVNPHAFLFAPLVAPDVPEECAETCTETGPLATNDARHARLSALSNVSRHAQAATVRLRSRQTHARRNADTTRIVKGMKRLGLDENSRIDISSKKVLGALEIRRKRFQLRSTPRVQEKKGMWAQILLEMIQIMSSLTGQSVGRDIKKL